MEKKLQFYSSYDIEKCEIKNCPLARVLERLTTANLGLNQADRSLAEDLCLEENLETTGQFCGYAFWPSLTQNMISRIFDGQVQMATCQESGDYCGHLFFGEISSDQDRIVRKWPRID